MKLAPGSAEWGTALGRLPSSQPSQFAARSRPSRLSPQRRHPLPRAAAKATAPDPCSAHERTLCACQSPPPFHGPWSHTWPASLAKAIACVTVRLAQCGARAVQRWVAAGLWRPFVQTDRSLASASQPTTAGASRRRREHSWSPDRAASAATAATNKVDWKTWGGC